MLLKALSMYIFVLHYSVNVIPKSHRSGLRTELELLNAKSLHVNFSGSDDMHAMSSFLKIRR